MMTLSLPSEIANTFQIANRFHSARTGSATVESLPAHPPQTDPSYSGMWLNSAIPP